MEALSLDLRRRIADALDSGRYSKAEIARRFSVTERWIYQFLALREETGDIKPRPHGGGRRPAITETQLKRIKEKLDVKPDATLDELRRYCRTSGSIMAVQRCLIREGITLKKRP